MTARLSRLALLVRLAASALALAAGTVVLDGSATARPGRAQKPDVPPNDGRRVYESRKCATCHQISGAGNVRFPLDGVGSRLAAADLRRWLTDTEQMERAMSRLPAVRMSEWLDANRKISAADVDALVAYLSTLK